jgi:rod shape-determining protein MreC
MFENKSGLNNSVIIFGLVLSVTTLLFTRIGVFEPLYPAVSKVFSDFQTANLNFFQKLNADLTFFSSITSYREENEKLKEENEGLIAKNTQQIMTIDELRKITHQLEFNKEFRQEPVRIIKFSDNQTEVMVNKGKDFQIKVDDVAVLENNLAGIVTEVADSFSKIRLIIDSQSRIPGIVLENSAKGFTEGQNSSTFKIKEIPNDRKLDPGMTVVSAGTDGIVPYGLMIGKLESIDSTPTGITQEATLKSILHFNDLSELFIIVK